ncbi:MAG: dTMP kinase [Planctomycetes bacterium]|nr:dTMP kinase [Planctomycetota bacterium]
MRGRLIVVEGVDGAGKTTQIRLLERSLGRRRRLIRLREPGGTRLGERIRRLLLDIRHEEMAPVTEVLLYMAARAQLVEEQIRPALRRGANILLDRYYHSTAAYQGAAGGFGVRGILDLAERRLKFPRPDLVLLLDLPPRTAARRFGAKKDRVERKGVAYQERVRAAFLSMARQDRRLFRVVDADRPVDQVHHDVLEIIGHVL